MTNEGRLITVSGSFRRRINGVEKQAWGVVFYNKEKGRLDSEIFNTKEEAVKRKEEKQRERREEKQRLRREEKQREKALKPQERSTDRVKCECGTEIYRGDLKRHIRSINHLQKTTTS